jgi:hypothetical protein
MRYDEVVEAVNKVIEEYTMRLTVRQIYYRLISPPFQLFANTSNNYKSFDKLLTRAREKQDVDWRKIEDRVRGTIGGDFGWENVEDYLNEIIADFKNAPERYTMPVWDNQPRYVEVWVEKDALATLFSQAARGFRIVTFPSRGYSSLTKVMEAVSDRFIQRLKKGQQIVILHFSDHDPSGLDMGEDLLTRFREYLATAMIDEGIEEEMMVKFDEKNRALTLIRCALTYEQVQQFKLASNPTKIADPRSKDYVAKYGDQCWELDAIPPDNLQDIIREAINNEIDVAKWDEILGEIEIRRHDLREKWKRLDIHFDDGVSPYRKP